MAVDFGAILSDAGSLYDDATTSDVPNSQPPPFAAGVSPTGSPAPQSIITAKPNYTPYIIGGVALIAVVALIVISKK